MIWILIGVALLMAAIFAPRLIAFLRRLLWLAARVSGCALVMLVTAILSSVLYPDDSSLIVMFTIASGMVVFWSTRHWGQLRPSARKTSIIGPRRRSLLSRELRERLNLAEQALARAARDTLGASAAEWLEFWRRRVPDLIRAAQDVYDDGDTSRKELTVQQLADDLDEIIAEAHRRVNRAKAARLDLFDTRTRHARARVQGG